MYTMYHIEKLCKQILQYKTQQTSSISELEIWLDKVLTNIYMTNCLSKCVIIEKDKRWHKVATEYKVATEHKVATEYKVATEHKVATEYC